tara:strand:+ start:388 stop:615 length:228 start_codon:yes stop_codon:yes gene_type:complete
MTGDGVNKATGPLRRALIYGLLSYIGLVMINNSSLELPNMWLAYLPMFVLVYGVTQWADRAIAARSAAQNSKGND